jgi:hypothetical protein
MIATNFSAKEFDEAYTAALKEARSIFEEDGRDRFCRFAKVYFQTNHVTIITFD